VHHVALLVQAKATEAKLVAEAVSKEHAATQVAEALRRDCYTQIIANSQLLEHSATRETQVAAHIKGLNDQITASSIVMAAEKAKAVTWEKQFNDEAS
jgi:hypothetical protein